MLVVLEFLFLISFSYRDRILLSNFSLVFMFIISFIVDKKKVIKIISLLHLEYMLYSSRNEK